MQVELYHYRLLKELSLLTLKRIDTIKKLSETGLNFLIYRLDITNRHSRWRVFIAIFNNSCFVFVYWKQDGNDTFIRQSIEFFFTVFHRILIKNCLITMRKTNREIKIS